MKSKNYIIVAGCSRFGANIASMLSKEGKDVIIIDKDKDSFRKLSNDFTGFKIEGNAADIEVLIEGRIEYAGTVVAATGDDNVNIMISEIAKIIFNVEKVVSRLYDFDKEIVYKDFDISTIYPAKLTVNEFEKLIEKDDDNYEKEKKGKFIKEILNSRLKWGEVR